MKLFNLNELKIAANAFPTASLSEGANDFEPIGIGRPLVVRLHTVHVGDLKNGPRNNRDRAILVTSMIKDDITSSVPPRAVHQIYEHAKDRDTLYPSARTEGTELIYYTPALDSHRLHIDIEVKADKFKSEVINDLSDSLASASNLPVFAPFASSVMVGSRLIKVTSDIFNKAIGKASIMSCPFKLSDDIGGEINTKAGFRFGCDEKDEKEFRGKGYEIRESYSGSNNFVLMKDNEIYKGNSPYVILSLDGRKVDYYRNFRATLASAAILERFYGVKENTTLDDLEEMVRIYNDFKFVNEAKAHLKSVEKAENDKEKTKFKELYEASRKNIQNEDLLQLLNKSVEILS